MRYVLQKNKLKSTFCHFLLTLLEVVVGYTMRGAGANRLSRPTQICVDAGN